MVYDLISKSPAASLTEMAPNAHANNVIFLWRIHTHIPPKHLRKQSAVRVVDDSKIEATLLFFFIVAATEIIFELKRAKTSLIDNKWNIPIGLNNTRN